MACDGGCKKQFTDVTRIAYQQLAVKDRRKPWFWQCRIVLHDLQTCPDLIRDMVVGRQ